MVPTHYYMEPYDHTDCCYDFYEINSSRRLYKMYGLLFFSSGGEEKPIFLEHIS